MVTVRIALDDKVQVGFDDEGRLLVEGRPYAETGRTSDQIDLLQAVVREGLEEAALSERMAGWEVDERLQTRSEIDSLLRRGILVETLSAAGTLLATRRIISPYYRPLTIHADDHNYRLSRFTYAHYEGGSLLLESPRCHAQVRLHDWQGAALMAAWSGSEGPLPVIPTEVRRALERFVAEVGLLVAVDEAGETAESNDDVLRQWAFHDLLFHARVRHGRHNNPLGGVFPFRGDIPETPPVKRPMSEEIVKLARPDLAEFGRREAPFTEILDGRRSLRMARARPLTLDELGTFLYRSARPLSFPAQPAVNRRPYPNAGGRYELELYILSHTCEGLAAGLYHYDAYQHGLEKLAVRPGKLGLILEQAAGAMGGAEKPAVLVLITARFQRVSWKYASIAYSLMLKNVGALYQTMYLTATAMGLHPCALGAGNSELFARVTGIPYEEEGTVGEFCLY